MENVDGMRKSRALASLAIGGTVGLTVASLVGIPQLVGPWSASALLSNALGFWGFLLGGFAAVTAAGVSFALLSRRDRKASRRGKILAGLTLGVFAAATVWWIAMWGFSPFTLEGMWIYPLAIGSTMGAFALLRRRTSGVWDEPPGS